MPLVRQLIYSSHYPAIHPNFFFCSPKPGQASVNTDFAMLDICSHSGGRTLFSMLLRSREGIGTMEARCSFRSIAISIQLRRMISHRHLQSNEGHSGRLHLLLSSSRLSPSSLAAVCRIAAAISSYIRPSRPF